MKQHSHENHQQHGQDMTAHHHEELHHQNPGSKITAEWKTEPAIIRSNEEAEFTIQIKSSSGASITSFKTVHDQKMHVLVISDDLDVFQHLHPTYEENGVFMVSTVLPKGGTYKVFADFATEGGGAQLLTHTVSAEGEKNQQKIVPDKELVRVIQGKQVTLSLSERKAVEHITMTFNIYDHSTGKPITNLQPYLGTAGHVVIVDQHLKQFLHTHPEDELASGPAIDYMTSFPKSGIYKIWGQFKHNGEVFTVPFVVEIP